MIGLGHVILPRAALRGAGPLAVAALLLAGGPQATRAQPADPDWPCQQRLVPELAASQMWAGAPAGSGEASGDDGAVAQLARQLASRAMPVDQAQQAIDRFAESLAPQERNAQLARLFEDALRLINQERDVIIAGIKRYTRKQRHLAEKIARESQDLTDVQPGKPPDPETQERLNERKWDVRVYEDRQRVLRQICEQPVLMEQRAFSLSRAMQARLEPD